MEKEKLSMHQHKTKKISIGIDLMGSDNDPYDLAKALIESDQKDDLELFLIGSKEVFRDFVEKSGYTFLFSEEVIEMEDSPLSAIRQKKSSSMHLGISLLKDGKIDAFISLGNTGALVGLSTLNLPMLPKITRPALLAVIPTAKVPLAVLDVGAHIECKIETFVEFAHLGNAFQKAMGIEKPRIGLLNIGKEKVKGTTQVKQVFALLEEKMDRFNFVGNIEGKEIFNGEVDVLLSDGFSGNIFLKTAEGIASLILDELDQNIPEENKTFFQDIKKRLHHAQYPGAILIGLKKLVVKCHGYSTPGALVNALSNVKEMLKEDVIHKLEEEL